MLTNIQNAENVSEYLTALADTGVIELAHSQFYWSHLIAHADKVRILLSLLTSLR